MTLTQEQKSFFLENGFVRYGKVLEAVEIARLRSEYDRVFAEALEENNYRNIAVDEGLDAESKKSAAVQMLQIMQMCERSLLFRRLLYDARILDAAEALIGPNILLLHDQALYKPAHTGGAVTWHQDNAYWKLSPAAAISCWLTLDDVDRENGAMQLIPGSHLRPLAHEQSANSNALLDSESQVDASRAVVVELPAGGCMFHHCQTLHYTQPNRTDRQRRAFAIHLMPPGTRNGAGEILRVGFGRPMLRMNM